MPFRSLRAWVFIPGFIALIAVLGLVHGSTTANSIPASRAGISFHPATAQQLAPPECAGMNLTTVAWQDNGVLQGTDENELLIGSHNTNRISGRGGNDCLVIGSGNNNGLDGGAGNDVCIGNPTTRFRNCEVALISGGGPAGFAQMELVPAVATPETTGTPGSEGSAGLEGSGEAEVDDQADPGGEATPEPEPSIEPTAESETEVDAQPAIDPAADPIGRGGPER